MTIKIIINNNNHHHLYPHTLRSSHTPLDRGRYAMIALYESSNNEFRDTVNFVVPMLI